MIKNLYYNISDPHISGSLNIDLSKCKNFLNLKKEIASQLNVESWQLDITNLPENINIEAIRNFSTLEIKVFYSKDITFSLLDGKQIKVKDSYKMRFSDVFKYFEQNGIYYSNSIISNNLEMFANGRQLLNNGYPFFGLTSRSIVEVRLKREFIIMKYEQNKFIFSESDKSYEAYQIIFESFGGEVSKDFIIIINEYSNEKVGQYDRLKSGEKYKIKIEHQFNFQNKSNEKDKLTLQMDFFSTVSDAQQILSEIFTDDSPIQAECIDIYDQFSQYTTDDKKHLKDIINYQKCIIFEINKYKISSRTHKTDLKCKTFYYHIKDPFICKQFKIDLNKCQTLYDLRSEIASKLKINEYKVKIINPPFSKEVKNISDYYNFELDISCCKDVKFEFQDGRQIEVKDSYKMRFNDVFKYFKRKGIHYSYSCINNIIKMFSNGKQLLKDGYPFFGLSSETIVEVRLKGEFIIMEYGQNKFIFSENEELDEAKQLILESFDRKVPKELIAIINEYSNEKVGQYDRLKSGEKYKIKIEHQFKFQNKSNEKDQLTLQMDFFSTVSDAQFIISDIFSDENKILPKNVIIKNENSAPISEVNLPLVDIRNYQNCIYFSVNQSKTSLETSEASVNDKILYYNIMEPNIIKRFKVDPKKYNSTYKLKHFIESLLKFKCNALEITNLNNNINVADIYEYSCLKLKVSYHLNIIFQNPNRIRIEVKDSYKMKFNDVFKIFRQKGLYYSKSCMDNLEMFNEGKLLPRESYPFLGITNQFVEVHLQEKFIIIEYEKNKFIFSENDKSDEAYQLIFESFGEKIPKKLIAITNEESHEKISNRYQLQSDEKYKIEIECQFKFQNNDNDNERLTLRMKYFSTISDAQQILSDIFSDEFEIRPHNVIIYDTYFKQITNQKMSLLDIQNYKGYILFSIYQNKKSSKRYEENSEHKIFYYHINCPYIYKRFKIDPKKCKTLEDLVYVILSKLNADPNQIDIINAPKVQNVEQIKNYYDFEIKNKYRNDLTFHFEDGKEIKVKNAYQMNFSDIIHYFGQKGIYYSFSCIRNSLEMISNGKQLSQNNYPFLFLRGDPVINIKMKRNTITIEYDQKQFSFLEGDDVYCAKNLIFNVFPEINYFVLVSIYNDKSSHELDINYELTMCDKYTAKIPVTFYFKLFSDSKYESKQKMDYFSTVSDGKERMSVIFEVDPRSIIIYDQSKKEVTDPNVFLKDIQVSYYIIYFNIDNKRILSSSHHKKKIKEREAEESKGKVETKISAPKEIDTKQSEESETAKVPSKKKIKIKGPTYTIVQSPKEKVSPLQHKDLEDISEEAKPKEESKIQKSDSKGKMIKIKFIFEDNQYPSFTKEMTTSTTFKEIEIMISKEHEISDKVLLQYKEDDLFINILSTDMEISEMESEISQKTESGATENVLYIKTEKSSKKSKPSLKSFRPKVAPQEEDKTSKSERPFKKKDIEQIKQKTEEEEDDDDQKSGVSMSYRPVKSKDKNDDLIRNKRANSSDDDDDSINDSSKLFNSTLSGSKRRKKPSAKNFMPKVTPAKDAKSPKNEEFKIIYKGKDKMISLKPGTTLDDNKELIKEKFGIGSKESIEFRTAPGGKEIEIIQKQPEKHPAIVDLQTRLITEQMSDSKETKPSSDNKPEPESPAGDDPLIAYKYQTNRSDDICEVKLRESGKVGEMKELIGKKNDVPNINNIKILFAGKNLVDDLVVSDLEVGEATLFVYIRSEEDIFLMTANALKVHPNNSGDEYEYEYQYEEDEED
ncbi:hypothetical protein M9Y10_014491 [Tritrichomonas musculus]|uniref:Ubiquitin-like domain-containing protein n=1 Tax=Tritrichomonas musculus TaxID=1915356 RepID=A0ABR2L0H5_9EUKA